MIPVKVLCIGGSDTSGGAGIQADLKAVSACGAWGMSVITAVTAQNTLGVQDIFPVSAEFVGRQMDTILSDIGADAVKTGMLLNAGIVEMIAAKVTQYKIEKLIVDPVTVAKGGRNLLPAKARQALVKRLLPLALLITPNIPEAEALVNMEIKTIAAMKKAAKIICETGAQNVLIKGGHLPRKQEAIDVLYDGSEFFEFYAPRINTIHTHGTGCTYASAIAAHIASGENMEDAVYSAKELVYAAIKNSVQLGSGYGAVHLFFNTRLSKINKRR